MANQDENRVPMPAKAIRNGDMEVSVSGPDMRFGRRFAVDVAEEALRRIPPIAVEHVAERIAEQVALSCQREIEDAVYSYLHDRTWAEPIIREAIRDAVDRFICGLLSPPEAH